MEYKKPFVYIDTNFSPADALFLQMALNSFDFELVGLSANKTFMSSGAASENILGLVNKNDLYLSVAKNLDDRKSQKDKAIFKSRKDYVEDIDAFENLYEIASDCGRLDIIASGDLSNIAKAIRAYDDFVDYIDHIFLYLGDIKTMDDDQIEDLDTILSSGIELFIIGKNFIDSFALVDSDLEEIFRNNQSLGEICKYYKDSDEKSLISPMLLYLLESPEAFIFEEAALELDKEEKEIRKTNKKIQGYLVNKVNEDSFYEYFKGKLG